jgi:hypothetical protein
MFICLASSRRETLPVANAVLISAQVDFGIVRLTKRKDNSKVTRSKFDSPKRCPDALHRIALESFLIGQMAK